MGRVPALEDGDVTIFESGAIVEYVLSRYGGGRMRPSPDSADFPSYLQWLHYAEGMIMPPVNTIVVETILLPPERRNDDNVNRATKLLSRMLQAVDAHMEGREYIAGEFSGADIMTGHACTVSTSRRGCLGQAKRRSVHQTLQRSARSTESLDSERNTTSRTRSSGHRKSRPG